MPAPTLTNPEPADPLATARHYAWVHYPWVRTVPLQGSTPLQDCWPAGIRDLAADRIGLVLRREIPVGTFIELNLHGEDGGCLRRLPALVAEGRLLDGPPRGGRWLLICDLPEPLTDNELHTLQTTVPGRASS